MRERFRRLVSIDDVQRKMQQNINATMNLILEIEDNFGGERIKLIDKEKRLEKLDNILGKNKYACIYGEKGS